MEESVLKAITSFVKRYPQPVFWAIAWATGFFGYFMSVAYPSDLWLLMIAGSFLGGLLVTALTGGRAAVGEFFRRIVRWRVGLQWYLIALAAPWVVQFVSLGASLLGGVHMEPGARLASWGDLFGTFVFSVITISLFEEPGFRGFALPHLMTTRTAWTASLIVGVLHGIWHSPLFIGGENSIWHLFEIVPVAVLFTWIFNKTNGSVLLCIVLHASSDASATVGSLFSGANLAVFEAIEFGVFIVVALLLYWRLGPELGRKREAAAVEPGIQRPTVAG
jgi:membrane protease YdiL (CAAX protease family)